jgi:hypothetical protein
MTDIEAKAQALLMEVRKERGAHPMPDEPLKRTYIAHEALCRSIERHEAFKQEVSDIAASALAMYRRVGEDRCMTAQDLRSLIIPKPKPDPLVEAMKEIGVIPNARALRAALEARGLEIREKNDG